MSNRKLINILIIIIITVISPFLVRKNLIDTHTLAIVFALLLAQYSKFTLKLSFFMLVVFGTYSLFGISYGYPDAAMLQALFETNIAEAKEFFRNIPFRNWILFLIFISLSVGYYLSSQIKRIAKIWLILIALLFIAALLHSWHGKLLRDSIKMTRYYYKNKKILANSLGKKDTWEISTNKNLSRYKNYVLIIGESARKDYMGVYGYKHDTTPYLSSVNGTFFDGSHSMAASTTASLTRSLQLTKNQGLNTIPQNNIVSLANKVGYETIWLSNAGVMGKHDSATSAVAHRSKKMIFLKEGIHANLNYDDMKLLPELKTVLNLPQKKSRLIILHVMGSHPTACERLHGYPVNFKLPYNKEVNCYLATIEKTDFFIKEVIKSLQPKGSYSLLYFSDHGVSVTTDSVLHSRTVKNNYQVPFFIINSSDKKHQLHTKNFSNIHFLDLFASWIGVSTNYTDDDYDVYQPNRIPEDKDIKVYFDNKMVNPEQFDSEKVLE